MATSSRRAVPVKGQPQQREAGSGVLKSSLDIVWSYSRSQAFFGSNLPSSPSFVQRYRRPGAGDSEEDEDGEDGDSFASSSRLHAEDASNDEEESDGSVDDSENPIEEDWLEEPRGSGSQARSSPRNRSPTKSSKRRRSSAKRTPSGKGKLLSRLSGNSLGLSDEPVYERQGALLAPPIYDAQQIRSEPSNAFASGSAIAPPLSERTPLLAEKSNDALGPAIDTSFYGSSPPEAVPFPRKSPHLRKRKLSEPRKNRKPAVHEGSSTSGQTLFNAINVLVGIGILAQPLAFSQAGWVLGVLLLIAFSALTNYTAKVLARVLADDPSLMTYADIGAKAFGQTARNFINILFCLEISALCVALIILLGDSLSIIFPWPEWTFKLIGFAVIFPTLFLPLRYLSVASIIGIISVVTLCLTVLIDGSISHHQPGSLRHPMPTSVGPVWRDLPISFGLIMSGFGGHAVFPSLARDMKRPQDFNKVCNTAFVVATFCYLFMAVIGYLMFGNHVSDEITRDLLNAPGLPRKLNLIAVSMVAITPLCKYSISQNPLEATLAYLLGVEQQPIRLSMKSGSSFYGSDFSSHRRLSYSSGTSEIEGSGTPRASGQAIAETSQTSVSAGLSSLMQPLVHTKPGSKAFARLMIKIVTGFVLLAIAIFVPGFDRVMGLLGSFSVFMICAIMPLSTDIALHRKTMSVFRLAFTCVLLLLSIAGGAVGTIWIFLPKRA